MSPDDDIHTAKAVRYLKANSLIINTPHGPDGTRSHIRSAMGPPPRPRPRPQNARFQAHSRAGAPDSAARSSPCFQNMQTTDLAQRIGDWERQCSPKTDKSSMGDKQPWILPEPIWAPAKFPQWPHCPPSPLSCSPSPPPTSPSPSLWRKVAGRTPTPSPLLENLSLHATSAPPPPENLASVPEHADFARKPERSELRQNAPISALTAQLKGHPIARNLAEADALREQREEKARKLKKKEQKRDEDFLREILKKKKPQVVFDKSFNFGPKAKEYKEDCELPLSPRSSRNLFSGLCSQTEQKSLKRPRHDSSNGDVMAKSPRAQLHSTSSPIPIQPSQSKLLAQRSLQRGFGTPEVHLGQLVHLTAHNTSDTVRSTEDKIRYMASRYKLSNIIDSCKTC